MQCDGRRLVLSYIRAITARFTLGNRLTATHYSSADTVCNARERSLGSGCHRRPRRKLGRLDGPRESTHVYIYHG